MFRKCLHIEIMLYPNIFCKLCKRSLAESQQGKISFPSLIFGKLYYSAETYFILFILGPNVLVLKIVTMILKVFHFSPNVL